MAKIVIVREQAAGKTVEKIVDSEKHCAIHFTDDTVLVIESDIEHGYYGEYELELAYPGSGELDRDSLSKLQIITTDENRQWIAAEEAKRRAAEQVDAERREAQELLMYQRLRKKYER